MKDKLNFFFHLRRVPHYLFHIPPASACIVLLATLCLLLREFFQ